MPAETSLPARMAIRDFSLDGRFALRTQLPGQAVQSGSGRLSWTHQGDSDHILLASPLGHGLAEIVSTPNGARLTTADGKVSESTDVDQLTEDMTGQRLPVRQLTTWLLGRPQQNTAQIESDAAGRPSRLREAGWRVDYAYDHPTPEALPSRLTLTRDGQIELKLRIETWKASP